MRILHTFLCTALAVVSAVLPLQADGLSGLDQALQNSSIDPALVEASRARAADAPTAAMVHGLRNTSFVVLRAEPRLESAAVAVLPAEVKFELLERLEGWLKVRCVQGTGYIRQMYFAPRGASSAGNSGVSATGSAGGRIGGSSSAGGRIQDTGGTSGGNTPAPPPATAKGGKALLGWLQAAGLSGETLRMAWSIAMGESGGNPRAFNGNSRTGDKSYGLFQINMIGKLGPARLKQFGLTSNEQLFDPMTNIKAMLKVSNNGKNWNPWSVYKHGTYKRFYSQFPPK